MLQITPFKMKLKRHLLQTAWDVAVNTVLGNMVVRYIVHYLYKKLKKNRNQFVNGQRKSQEYNGRTTSKETKNCYNSLQIFQAWSQWFYLDVTPIYFWESTVGDQVFHTTTIADDHLNALVRWWSREILILISLFFKNEAKIKIEILHSKKRMMWLNMKLKIN